ncbi:MAG: DUF2793 domain-containing protein [Shimia sp.]
MSIQPPAFPDSSTVLGLPYIQSAQAQKHVTHNEALRRLDALVQAAVHDADRTAPPAAPQDGDRHLVAPGATGAWTGHDGALALFDGGAWLLLAPRAGWRVEVLATGGALRFDGTAWSAAETAPSGAGTWGVNATADTTNRLTVAAPATLLTHAGADHRLKLNKAAAGDTAALLFQTAWGGRAEIGTLGEDAFAIKTSADGAAWTTALRLDPDTGHATGAAVQQDAADTTPGRLLTTTGGVARGALLDPVAMAAGLPAGGVLERRLTPLGLALRLACGTQICSHVLPLGASNAVGGDTYADPYATAAADWTFPAPFTAAPAVTGTVMGAAPHALGLDAVTSTGATGLVATRLRGGAPGGTATAHLLAVGRWS